MRIPFRALLAFVFLSSLIPGITVSAASAPESDVRRGALVNDPLAGPVDGYLLEAEGSIETDADDVGLRDLVVAATFRAPDDGQPWDVGIGFRYAVGEEDDHFRLILDSLGEWYLTVGADNPIAQGAAPGLALVPGAENAVELVVAGPTGTLTVNGEQTAELDLRRVDHGGDVFVSTALFSDDTVPGRTDRYEEFTVWAAGRDVRLGQPSRTAEADPTGTVARRVVGVEPIHGPQSAFVTQRADRASLVSANVEVTDLYAVVTWVNAFDPASQAFDVGFSFRSTAFETEFRIALDSDGYWSLLYGGEPVQSGWAPGYEPARGEETQMELLVIGDVGWFRVNGVPAGRLGLGATSEPGDVRTGFSYFADHAQEGERAEYVDFTVWSLDDLPAQKLPDLTPP